MPLDAKDVQNAIAERGLGWLAGETSVSHYANQRGGDVQLFGLNIGDEEASQLLESARSQDMGFLAAAPLPSSIDWRNIDGQNFVSPIRNQKNCGACVAFATCASLEARAAINAGDASLQLDLSEAHLFFCGCGACCRTGWNFVPALDWARNGVGAEAAFPYGHKDQPCTEPQPPAVVTVPAWRSVASTSARKQAIADSGPVIAGLRVYEDFYFYKSGVYRHVTGAFRGLHAVCVVGYDDGKGCWTIKNSWGTGWGEEGFMDIAYGQCDMDSTYPFYDPTVVTVSPVTS